MHAHYYRRMLCAAAKNLPWNEPMPVLSYTEWANRKVYAAKKSASKSAEEHKLKEKVQENTTKADNIKDKVNEKTQKAATKVKGLGQSLWARAKTLTFKKQPEPTETTWYHDDDVDKNSSSDQGEAAATETIEQPAAAQ